MFIKIKKNLFILIIITFSILKFSIAFIYGDHSYDMEWTIIVKNLLYDFSFSFHEINGQKIPTAYMPPLYIYIIYAISLLGYSEFITVKIILLLQCLFSGVSLIFFYKILLKYFNKKYSIIFSLIYFFIPINFYAATQISSVSLQISIFIFFLYYYLNAESNLDFIKLAIFSGLAALIRGEFWLLLLILIFYRIITKSVNLRNLFFLIFFFFLIISPTLFRNYIVFDEFLLVKSSGYNLWRGNNIFLNINGENIDTLQIELEKQKIKDQLIETNNLKKYEIYVDRIYFTSAKKNIFSEPLKYFSHYINKFVAFSFFNFYSNYEKNFHPLIIIPEIIISLFGILGIIFNIFSNKINKEILIISFYYLFLIPIFFILPRYKMFIFPMYVYFSCYFFTFLFNKIFSNKQ